VRNGKTSLHMKSLTFKRVPRDKGKIVVHLLSLLTLCIAYVDMQSCAIMLSTLLYVDSVCVCVCVCMCVCVCVSQNF